MVHNVGVIHKALQTNASQPPAAALAAAAQSLQTQGRGGTSQYYAQGLSQAASQLTGQSALNNNDVLTLVQSVLGSIPAQGNSQATTNMPGQSGAGSVLETLMGMAGGATQGSQTVAPPATGDLLGGLLGALGGQNQPGATQTDGQVLNDLVNAGERFLQAKQAGSDNMTAITQAAMGALMGSQPLQSSSPQAAAGGLIAQSVLGALLGRR
jgi:hypothetical protein